MQNRLANGPHWPRFCTNWGLHDLARSQTLAAYAHVLFRAIAAAVPTTVK
jgi:hypothetical protein